MRVLFTLIAIIFVSCGIANAEVEKCTIATKYVCTPEECVKKDSSIWILLDFAKEEYSRCDTKGCDTYKMTVDVGGIYINIFSTGFKSKVSADRKEFMEYVSLRTTSYLSYGSCEKL